MKEFVTTGDFKDVHTLEWLETNGLGGYAGSTVSGAHSRKYHGLLIAAMNPPMGRMALVTKLDETIVLNNVRYELGTNQYPGAIHPTGYRFLKSFQRDLFPEFVYAVEGVEIRKTIVAVHGENTVLVLYEVLEAPARFTFELMPLYSTRDFHWLSHANDYIGRPYLFEDGTFRTVNYFGCPEFFISVPKSRFVEQQGWYYNFEYSVEESRGVDFREDLYTHGSFHVPLRKGSKLGVILSTENPAGRDAFALMREEKKRREKSIKSFATRPLLRRLVLAADQFIVKRGDLNTIVAGYHWFGDWGRDTMIALPGLCLVTGRYADAKKILQAFAKYMSDGMLPNRFPDYQERPDYNTIDATLWFFHAIYKYYQYTKDTAFVREILPVLTASIEWHYKGTRYNIHVDPEDELLQGGEEGVQLTWMDAKTGNWVVTPRRGKPVEINALWYNALRIMSYFSELLADTSKATDYAAKAQRVSDSFNAAFWNDEQQCLYDYIENGEPNADIRPNQLYALSLSFPLLSRERGARVVDVVTKHLLTPRGLRSLSPEHKDYRAVYGGDVWYRDGAYHQGTVWSFLLGAYIDALIYTTGEKAQAGIVIHEFLHHLDEACVGSVSEIFDGKAPHLPRGCAAQAWGVGEVLRVAVEHALLE